MRSSNPSSRSSTPDNEPECAEIQGVLHDVANSLTVVVGWLSCACERLGRGERGANEAQIALKYAQQARLLLRSSVASEHKHSTQLEVTWSELLDDMTTAVMPAADKKNICVQMGVDPQTAALFVREPVAVYRVLTNLLFNAVSFAPWDSNVEVRLRAAAGDFVNVLVSDEGPGLDTSDVDSVFGGIRSTRHSGEGIGLRVAHALAQRCGGRLELMGAGPGATFSLTWPNLSADEVQNVKKEVKVSRSSNDAMPFNGLGVAVLEDDLDLAQLVETGLTLRGAEVWAVGEAEALGDILKREHVHVVLLDLSPITGATEQARLALRLIDSYPHIRWLAMTGAARPLDERLKKRLSGVIHKPFDMADLVRALAKRCVEPTDSSAYEPPTNAQKSVAKPKWAKSAKATASARIGKATKKSTKRS